MNKTKSGYNSNEIEATLPLPLLKVHSGNHRDDNDKEMFAGY